MALVYTGHTIVGVEGIPLGVLEGQWGAAGVLALVAVLVITDKLVWHKRLRLTEQERDHWRGVALTALGVADKMTVHGEVTAEVLTRLPDPAAGSAEDPGP